RLTTADARSASRANTSGRPMSAGTTVTVGSTWRCCALSGLRVGTTTLSPLATSASTTWRPTNPAPPRTRIGPPAMPGLPNPPALGVAGHGDGGNDAAAAGLNGAETRLQRHVRLIERTRV